LVDGALVSLDEERAGKASGFPRHMDGRYGTRTVELSPVAEMVKTPVVVSAV
jgi:hypothetical protein